MPIGHHEFVEKHARRFPLHAHEGAALDQRLVELLPTEMFLAACFIEIDAGGESVSVWNGGIPDAWLCSDDGNAISHRFASAIESALESGDIAEEVQRALAEFRGDAPRTDDLTLLEFIHDPTSWPAVRADHSLSRSVSEKAVADYDGYKVAFEFEGELLLNTDSHLETTGHP